MSVVYGIRWDDGKRVRIIAALAAALLAIAVFAAMRAATDGSLTSVVVSARPDSTDAAARSVEALGGKVGARISIIHGFIAKMPANRISELRSASGVLSAVADRRYSLSTDTTVAASPGASLALVKQELGADQLASDGVTGKGVDIAMVDSGVVPVAGLSGKVYVGPDFTPEAYDPSTRGLDTFGHGTHLAGIMVGENDADGFEGVAPGARLVSVKAASADGSTSLGQLLLAIGWVVSHRQQDGLNIRVLNLSVGAPLVGSYTADPLAYAVEQAWDAGIVVVAAAGNGNGKSLVGLDTPAADPYVVAVGASDTGKLPALDDDRVPPWSRIGTSDRTPDVVAPGTSLVSLRDPGSFIDQNYPGGRVGTDYFKGSGTSQATAVVSASAALVLQQNPDLTPDQVKALLEQGANPVPEADQLSEGAGQIDVETSSRLPEPTATQDYPHASLSAILNADRSQGWRVDPGGTGKDLSANRWSANRWSANRWSANRWSANRWSANRWSASRWSDSSWGDTSGS